MTDHKIIDITTGKPTPRNFPVDEMDFRQLVIQDMVQINNHVHSQINFNNNYVIVAKQLHKGFRPGTV